MVFLTTRQNDFWESLSKDFDWLNKRLSLGADNIHPGYEVSETEKEYKIAIDIPGVPKQDISIDFKNDQITISAERKYYEKNSLHSTRQYGLIKKSFSIPQGVDVSKICAEYENGTLIIQVPKPNITTLPTQIPIK